MKYRSQKNLKEAGLKKEKERNKGGKVREKSEEEVFESLFKAVEARFRMKLVKAQKKFNYLRQVREEEKRKKFIEEAYRREYEAMGERDERLRWKCLKAKDKGLLSQEERYFLMSMNKKYPNPFLSSMKIDVGYYLYYYYDLDKIDHEEAMQANEIDREDPNMKLDEKGLLFDSTVKAFRTKLEDKKDWKVLQMCYRFLGLEYLKKHNIREALKYFQAFKTLCGKNKAYTMKMLAYDDIGFCYKLVKQYKLALINFKKLLQLAWYRKHLGWELKAYDYISIAYYYLGEIDKSNYYYRRMWDGAYENENSTVRKLTIEALKKKLEASMHVDDLGIPQIKDDSSYVIYQSDEDENDLPSPRTGSGEENIKFLPFSNLKKPDNTKSLPFIKTQKKKVERQNSTKSTLSTRVKPFMLISHLSPNESPNNYFYVDQMNSFRIRGEQYKGYKFINNY